MARFYESKRDRAEKFVNKLKTIASDPSFNLIGPKGGKAALTAIAKFLAAYGSKVARLNKTARGELLQQTVTQDQNMREKALEQIQATSKREIKNYLEKYNQGKIDKKALRMQLQSILKRQTLTAAVIGVKGVGNLTDNVLTAVKRQLSVQLAYLDGFLEDIETRQLTAKDKARASQYANAVWSIAQTATRQFNLDMSGVSAVQLEERRRLGGAEHCDDCVELADSWEPFGTLPVPGQGTVCGSNCRCTLEVRPITDDTKSKTQTTNENPVPQDK